MLSTIYIDWWLWRVVFSSWAITEYAKKNWKTNVITNYPLVFWNNPHVKVYWVDDRRLFEEVINISDVYIEIEPYKDIDFFKNWKHVISVISKQLWLWYKLIEPKIYLTELEESTAKELCKWKKIALIQPFGSSVWNQNDWDETYRSMKLWFAYELTSKLIDKWYSVYQISNNQVDVSNANKLNVDLRQLFWIIKYADLVVWVDSFMIHTRKALWWTSIVLRAWTDEKRFWYEKDVNIREFDYKWYVPNRLQINDFSLYNINCWTNNFTENTLNKIIDLSINI